MARYRIVKRGSFVQAGVPVFEVEERSWLWWEPRGTFDSLAGAELRVADLKLAAPIKTAVVKKYD
jgi:hypothetical protein